ncbi:MAG: M28 family peptidase [Planctomycetota bacterium]|nr:M28 family peptidase [Planctomycetota bacterium]
MRSTSLIFGAIAVLAACFGASLKSRSGDPANANYLQKQDAETPIDQKKLVALEAVRAPQDLGERAMAHARTLVNLGPRHSGAVPTEGYSKQLDFITAELKRSGVNAVRDTWTDRRELVTFTNISAVIPGKRSERIVFSCHHDTKCAKGHKDTEHNFAFAGANDGASGVALLLALAPVLVQGKHEATIELLFFDGEESMDWDWNNAARALFGSKHFVEQHRDAELKSGAPKIAAMLLLDMVGRKDLHIQEELYSTARLRTLVFSAAHSCGHAAHFFRGAEAASDDHRPFLDVGIPSIDLIDLKDNPHWHKPTDTIDNLSAVSLQIVAEVVLTALPAIEREYLLDPR